MQVLLNTLENKEGRGALFNLVERGLFRLPAVGGRQGFRGPTLFWSGPLEPKTVREVRKNYFFLLNGVKRKFCFT